MYFIEMLAVFFVLSGLALFFRNILRVNMGEGMMLSVALIALFFSLSSIAGTFSYGFYGILAVSAVGIVLCLVQAMRAKCLMKAEAIQRDVIFSPVFLCLFFLFLFWLVILYHDFIQHIDELHQWAAAVKYMLTRDLMPTGSDFLGGGGQYAFATSLFHLFFQKFTGYNEQTMYVSASLLMWIGFLLPFSACGRKDWKKIAVYTGIMYIALFTLYSQGSKSLYVDLPTASWAGGLSGWWMNRKKKKADYLIAGSGLIMLHFFKASAGLLMAMFVLIFMLLYTFVAERRDLNNETTKKKMVYGAAATYLLVIMGSVGLLGIAASIRPYEVETTVTEELADPGSSLERQEEAMPAQPQRWQIAGVKLPDRVSDIINTVKLSGEKIKKTAGAFLTKSFGDPLAPRSNWDVGFVPLLLLLLLLLKAGGIINGQGGKGTFYVLYGVFVSLTYSAALFFSYLFMFAYELSVDLRSSRRYFSICCIYLFILALTVLLQRERKEKETMRQYVLAAVAVFFALGINDKFIPNVTALDKENTAGYNKLSNTQKQIKKINSVIGVDDKVYYICQYDGKDLSDAELFNASALYYLESQVSNYLAEPWKFTEDGCNIRLEEYDISLADLPALLAQGGYTYLWILRSDDYLEENLPTVLDCEDVGGKSLYRIEYVDGVAAGLELVKKL